MSRYVLTGLPAGSTEISAQVRDSGEAVAAGSATRTVTSRALPSVDVYAVSLKSSVSVPAMLGLTMTVENDTGNGGGSFTRFIGGCQSFEVPIQALRVIAGPGTTANRIVPVSPDDLSRFRTYGHGAFNGGEVLVWRSRSGAVDLVRVGEVSDWSVRQWENYINGNRIVPPEARTGYRIGIGDCAPGKTMWFSVCPVYDDGATGKATRGGISGSASWTTALRVLTTSLGNASSFDVPALEDAGSNVVITANRTPTNFAISTEESGQVAVLTWDAPVDTADLVGYYILMATVNPSTFPTNAQTDISDRTGNYVDLVDDAGVDLADGDYCVVKLRRDGDHPDRDDLFHPRHARDGQVTRPIWDIIAPPSVMNGEETDRVGVRVAHPANTAPTDGGQHFARFTLAEGAVLDIDRRNGSGTADGQVFDTPIEAARPWRSRIWLRSQSGPVTAEWFWDGNPTAPTFSTTSITVTSSWQQFETVATWAADYTGTQVGGVGVRLTAGTGGCVVDVDGLNTFYDGEDYGDFMPWEYDVLYENGVQALRNHETVKTSASNNIYDLQQITNPMGAIFCHRTRSATLPSFLRRCLGDGRGKFLPWMQFENYLDGDEWTNLIEYLAAPWVEGVDTAETKPWAHKRAVLQGRVAPWTDEWDTIPFEIGNETWNPLFLPWTFEAGLGIKDENGIVNGGTFYGQYCMWVISRFEASPYWSAVSSKFKFVLGGWRNQFEFSEACARACPKAHYLMTAAYNGGLDEGEGALSNSPGTYQGQLNFPRSTTVPSINRMNTFLAEVNAERVAADAGYPTLVAGTYEAGPGYRIYDGWTTGRAYEVNDMRRQGGADYRCLIDHTSSTPGEGEDAADAFAADLAAGRWELVDVEGLKKSVSAGVATLDNFLLLGESGYAIQNFFRLEAGVYWSSHTGVQDGAEAYCPVTALGMWFREAAELDFCRTYTRLSPSVDITDSEGDTQPQNRVGVYVATGAGKVVVALVSRTIDYTAIDSGDPLAIANPGDDGSATVRVDLPISAATGLKRYRLTGAYDAGNQGGTVIQPTETTLSVPATPSILSVTLNAATAEVYVFSGVTP